MELKDLTDKEKKEIMLEQLGLIYLIHASVAPAMVNIKLYLDNAEMIEKTGFKDDLVMNLEFMTAKLLKLSSPTVSNELIEIFLDKFEEIYPDKFQKKINDIAEDLNKNFTKILLSIDKDLNKPTTH